MLRSLPDRTAFWILLFAAYAAAAAAIRLQHVETLMGDDAESFLWSRTLDWGYGVQPPLYAWLHWATNRVFGETLASTVAIRALSLTGLYAGAFVLARRFAPVRVAGLAALGVFLVPEISQTFLRTRTHNMLATALAPLVVLAFLNLLARGRAADHALFGAVAALGILAKATAAVLPVALVLAALAHRETRAALLSPKTALALAAMAAVLAGPAAWLFANLDLGTASLAKFEATDDGGGQGIVRFLRSMLDSWGVVALLAGLALLATRATQPPAAEARLVLRAGAVAVALVVAGILATGTTEVKERWLVPILVPLVPVVLVVVMQRRGWPRLVPPALAGLYALAMLAALPAYHRDRPRPPIAPYAALADAVAEIPADLILGTSDVAANMALARPGLPTRQRVDRGREACRGTVILIARAPDPVDRAGFAARLGPCTVTLAETRRIAVAPDRTYVIEVLDLAAPG